MGPKGKDVKVGLASKPKLAGWGELADLETVRLKGELGKENGA